MTQIIPGISVNSSGQATIDSSISDVLFDLAINLEELTSLPVDIEHVVAAIVLAVRNNKIDTNSGISADDPALIDTLAVYVKSVFALYGGKVASDFVAVARSDYRNRFYDVVLLDAF